MLTLRLDRRADTDEGLSVRLWAGDHGPVASPTRHIGANVKAVREQQGMSRREAAERLGIGRDYLASIERGEANLTLRSVERLADGLGVDVHVLIAENETVLASEAIE